MIVFIENTFNRAWQAYIKATDIRFTEMAHGLLILLIYEGLLLIAYNPNAPAYNGVDAWFKYAFVHIPGGTRTFSLLLVAWFGYVAFNDWMGQKTLAEHRNDLKEAKKNKLFKPKPKSPLRKDKKYHYYFVAIMLEGLVYGALIFMLLRWIIFFVVNVADGVVYMPQSLDESAAMRPFLTNALQDIALAFGAGFYEELIFRGLLFMGIAKLAESSRYFKSLKVETAPVSGHFKIKVPKPKRDPKYYTVVAFGTLIYAMSHYLFPFGDTFTLYSVLYRFGFGWVMFYIFVRRKFSVAAWTHIWYDLMYFAFET